MHLRRTDMHQLRALGAVVGFMLVGYLTALAYWHVPWLSR
jgi:hypothetical protein